LMRMILTMALPCLNLKLISDSKSMELFKHTIHQGILKTLGVVLKTKYSFKLRTIEMVRDNLRTDSTKTRKHICN
jgi:hypothetical protein